MPKIPVKLVDWSDIVEWSWGLAKKIEESNYIPDVVIAISRGGYVPARLLCDFLGVENLLSIQSQHWTEAAKKGERAIIKFEYVIDLSDMKALLVDDIVDTGDSVILAKEYILRNWKPKELRTAALQWISSVAKIKPDYYFMEVREWYWFQYPWTRLEDVTQFIKRILESTYKESGKSTWRVEELTKEFKEWYGIEVDKRYIDEAIKMLIKKRVIKAINNELVYLPG
ncbi:phosphoribosyltransferase [Ignisphaera sp. 4213-co]|uniref:Phosphoribosyltransferase n=1 Tax=Ignisphaera cupida TaxID=3050454 RepID=A0ABD4Z3R0_9CREN|nr:phosphoribosyltransferase [Ignisphaera sp. 4213-co]MDK6027956.1 phosphoribosyltransferase [Ignisphaera sp. 4213-co]